MKIKYANKKTEETFNFIHDELKRATVKYPPIRSIHEGYGILKAKLDDLWEQIKKHPNADRVYMKREASQVAAMAIRFILDCCREK